MEERIVRFITALRAGGVRVSLAESADAFRAVEQLGVHTMFLMIGIPTLIFGIVGLYRRLKADRDHVFVANW